MGSAVTRSFSEVKQTLLAGETLSWPKFGNLKAGSVLLSTPGQRRLFHFLLSCNQEEAARADEVLFDGLITAWKNTHFDPGIPSNLPPVSISSGSWRLIRIETSGFGGLNQVDGPIFVLNLDGENLCLEGQNGSGKTSIASAVIWAMTGYRCRDQDGIIHDDGQRLPVYNDSGIQIGDWPPIVSYPSTVQPLSGTAITWVRLIFQDQNGNSAQAFRRLTARQAEMPEFEVNIDAALLSAPQLVETGLLMPARLARIGFGEKSQTIYAAVKLLTGLDQLDDISEGAANFTHKSKRFLKYALDNGTRSIETKLELSLKRADEEAKKAGYNLEISRKRENEDYAKELREVADSASKQAGIHIDVLASDVDKTLDTGNSADRDTIKKSVVEARGILQQNTKGIKAFEAWASLRESYDDVKFQCLSVLLGQTKVKLSEAIKWDKRQTEDAKLRLKALASQFFLSPDHTHEDADCPLCESKLSGDKRRRLADELKELKSVAVDAEKRLSDVCAALEQDIRASIPEFLDSHFSLLKSMQPRDSFRLAATERFVEEPPFSTVLIGIAEFAKITVNELVGKLPLFTPANVAVHEGVSRATEHLLSYIGDVERVVLLVKWWNVNRQSFVDSWTTLKGIADDNHNFPDDSLEGKLALLEAAVEKAIPLDEQAKALREAATEAEKWLKIYEHQIVRVAIAQALEPLKGLRTFVAVQTAGSISALSGRMKLVLDRIHFRERLSFQDAALNKKSVKVTGSFGPGIRIDVSTVANSSWLRAILWAFIFASREQALETLSENPFPLVVLDDPQATFDPRNKRKWAEEIASHANENSSSPVSMQLLAITHERQFFQILVNLERLTGQQGLVVGLNGVSKVTTVVNGNSLARSFADAETNNDDAKGHKYILDVRTYCEDLLKIMLRSEGPDVCDLTIDALAKLMKRLRESSVAPFNRASFEKLLNTIVGGGGAKPMKIINETHHKFDGTIGVSAASDVKLFWEKTLQSQIHTCFKVYAEFESYSGEPRLFPWMDNVIPLPTGNATEIRKLSMKHTGIAAAAMTDGRAGDGLITIEELQQSASVTLHNHDAYQLSAGTLDPIAGVGDVIIVSNYAKVHERNLVVVSFGDQLLARRYNETEIHPHIVVLTGHSTDPHALVQPVIAPLDKIEPRKIIGTLFVSKMLPTPSDDENIEFAALDDLSVVRSVLLNANLFRVDGRSAEPIALDGQYIVTRPISLNSTKLTEINGRLVIAVDENGARYFKRFRQYDKIIVLESLNPDGTTPSIVLSLDNEISYPKLANLLEVVGVLFELPNP